MRIKQTAAEKGASLAFSNELRQRVKPNTLSVPIIREGEPLRHKATGKFIARADVNHFLRGEMLAKARPGSTEAQEGDSDE